MDLELGAPSHLDVKMKGMLPLSQIAQEGGVSERSSEFERSIDLKYNCCIVVWLHARRWSTIHLEEILEVNLVPQKTCY